MQLHRFTPGLGHLNDASIQQLVTLATYSMVNGNPCRDWEDAYKELEMQRGYCAVATRYSPALIRNQALSSPQATLKARPEIPMPALTLQLYLCALLCLTVQKAAAQNSQYLLRACILRCITASVTVAALQVLARFVEMFSSLGWFFGSLFFDQLSGAADNSSRVRYRAAQLRCAHSLCIHPYACSFNALDYVAAFSYSAS